jgi:LPXTG-site transpeptidase (sortase) family protein
MPPVRITIPDLGLDAEVTAVTWEPVLLDGSWQTQWQTADGAVGHHRNSAKLGEEGNIVLSGHHNTKGEVFRQVSEIGQPGSPLGQGDSILLYAEDGQVFEYVVVEWHRLREEGATTEERQANARYLEQSDKVTLTLITCWPYEANTHRVVVVAEPVQ